jgi:hypothetical protein
MHPTNWYGFAQPQVGHSDAVGMADWHNNPVHPVTGVRGDLGVVREQLSQLLQGSFDCGGVHGLLASTVG